MRKSITCLPLKALENGTHFEFMTACSTFFGGKTYENELVNGALKQFNDALAAEDVQLKIFTANKEMKNVVANDKIRGNCFVSLRGCARVHSLAYASPIKDVAHEVLATIDKYNLNIHGSYDKETGILRNLIDDLKKGEGMIDTITTMGMKPVLDEMERTNLAVATAQDARDRLNELRSPGGMIEARKVTDAAYDHLRDVLESAAVMFGEPFKADIVSWNSTVNRYKTNLERKQAISAARRKQEANKPQAKPDANTPGANTPNSGSTGNTGGNGDNTSGNTGSTGSETGTGSGTGTGSNAGNAGGTGSGSTSGTGGNSGGTDANTPSGGNTSSGSTPQGGTSANPQGGNTANPQGNTQVSPDVNTQGNNGHANVPPTQVMPE